MGRETTGFWSAWVLTGVCVLASGEALTPELAGSPGSSSAEIIVVVPEGSGAQPGRVDVDGGPSVGVRILAPRDTEAVGRGGDGAPGSAGVPGQQKK